MVTAWLVLQVSDVILGNVGAPDWVFKVILLLLAIGLPLALIFAWAFEMTAEGLKRERDVDRSRPVSESTGRGFNLLIVGSLVLALGYFIWERYTLIDAIDSSASGVKLSQQENLTSNTNKRSIAVLPFVNMSSDEEQEWFADGLTEELLNALARTADLLVTARTSSFRYKGTNEDIPTIARALGVENVLEGSVRRSGDRLRVTAQLIRASDGFHLWSQNYDRNMTDIIELQEELATSIARVLQTATDPEALADMVNVGTRSVTAYQSYLRGIEFKLKTWATVDGNDANTSLKAFEKAVEIDPGFSRAYMEIAESWGHGMYREKYSEQTPDETLAIRIAAIDNAILNEDNPVVRIAYKALRVGQDVDDMEALRLWTEYLESRPNSTHAVASQISIFRTLGRLDESVNAAKAYFELYGYDVGVADDTLHTLRDGWDKDREFSLEYTQGVLERFPDQPLLLYQAHRALLAGGEIEAAILVHDMLRRLNLSNWDGRFALMTMRQLCAEGKNSQAAQIFETATRNNVFSINKESWATYMELWLANMILGRNEKASDVLAGLDNAENWRSLNPFRGFNFFDPRPYPYLMERLEGLGIPPKVVTTLPYRCNSVAPATGNGHSS